MKLGAEAKTGPEFYLIHRNLRTKKVEELSNRELNYFLSISKDYTTYNLSRAKDTLGIPEDRGQEILDEAYRRIPSTKKRNSIVLEMYNQGCRNEEIRDACLIPTYNELRNILKELNLETNRKMPHCNFKANFPIIKEELEVVKAHYTTGMSRKGIDTIIGTYYNQKFDEFPSASRMDKILVMADQQGLIKLDYKAARIPKEIEKTEEDIVIKYYHELKATSDNMALTISEISGIQYGRVREILVNSVLSGKI